MESLEKGHEYTLNQVSIEQLSYSEILKHSPELIGKNSAITIQAKQLEPNFGIFSNSFSGIYFPDVSIFQNSQSLFLTCGCNSTRNRLCEHEVQVLHTIMERPHFRIFFDNTLRNQKIKETASLYGFKNEQNLENYFSVVFNNQGFKIIPTQKELLLLDEKTKKQLTEKLLIDQIKVFPLDSEESKTILLLGKHKFAEHFTFEIAEVERTKDGKVKTPIQIIDPSPLIWTKNEIDEIKFLSAILKFQKTYSESNPSDDLQALKAIQKNPFNYEIYLQNSEKLVVNELQLVKFEIPKLDFTFHVNFKAPFYEVSGSVSINNKKIELHELQIKYTYFICQKEKLYLITDLGYLKIINFFANNNPKILIHPLKYEDFKLEFLEKLETKVNIDYTYLQKADAAYQEEWKIETKTEQIIYLSDQKNFVSITPVIKYGAIEVPVFSKKQLFDKDPNGNVIKINRNEDLELKLTTLLSRLHPEFHSQLGESDFFYLHKQKFLDENWFLDFFEELKQNDIKILGFNELKNNKINSNKAKVSINVVSGIDWFSTDIQIKYGKQKATLKELHKSLRNKNKFVQLDDGTMGILPEEWLAKFSSYFRQGKLEGTVIKTPKSNFLDILDTYEQDDLSKEVWGELNFFKNKLENFEEIKICEAPKELKAKLRDYQQHGLNWLNFLDDFQFGACLADDMGLGKTIQILAFLLSQRNKNHHNTNLIIVPTSLLFNWQAEIEKFAPSLKVFINYNGKKIIKKEDFDAYEIILTTYGMLLSDIRFLKNYRFNYVILDESQAIKNPESQRYIAARMLQARNRIVMTGTPIENNTFDLYGQLSFVNPGLLGSKTYFRDIYGLPIDKFNDDRRAKELQRKVNPFILRRTKKQVANELPLKTEMLIYCEMGEEQRKVYDEYETELREYIQSKKPEDLAKNSMHVLTGITKLRQICNSPAILPEEEIKSDSSSKLNVLIKQIESKSSQHKILVFSQFVKMLDLIKKELIVRNINFEYLTGQTKNRAEKVKNFQENSEVKVFLVSLKAGGVGLNLTQADYVYLVDPWWNPAVENQAIDRTHRIGQTQKVVAIRLICPNTIEEKMMELQASKVQLAENLIKTDTTILKSLTKAELLRILR